MAYETRVDDGATDALEHPLDGLSEPENNSLNQMTNIAGAFVSLALIAGVGIWGYKLMMRDVTGIPIVRAAQGEMRVRPEDPGGQLAQHQGLSVNVVAAEGGAEKPAERLVLAPQPVELTDEDVPIDEDAVAIVQQAIEDQSVWTTEDGPGDKVMVDAARVAEAAESGSVEDMVAVLTENADSIDGAFEEGGPERIFQASATSGADIQRAVASALAGDGGLHASLRPRVRPEGLNTVAVSFNETRASYFEVDPDALPTGTRLVQLGAYDTAELARTEWDKFHARFNDLMTGKDRVVQEASSGGRDFYRLRAVGFDDLADARRFCAAIVADGADCIPVVTR